MGAGGFEPPTTAVYSSAFPERGFFVECESGILTELDYAPTSYLT
jgi:hypothetical protein